MGKSNETLGTEFTVVEDWSLAEHDKIYHKGGYKEGDSCKVREGLSKADDPDAMVAKAESDLNYDPSENERAPLSGDDPDWTGRNSLWATGRKRYGDLNDTDKSAFEAAYEQAKKEGNVGKLNAIKSLSEAASSGEFSKNHLEWLTKQEGLFRGNSRGMEEAVAEFKNQRRKIGMAKQRKYLDIVGQKESDVEDSGKVRLDKLRTLLKQKHVSKREYIASLAGLYSAGLITKNQFEVNRRMNGL